MNVKAAGRTVAVLAIVALMSGCSVFGALIPVSGLSLNKSADTIAVGSSDNLRVTISPSYAADPGLSWSSSDTIVATVSSGGLVTGKASGSATVTVSAPGGGIKASCVITVVPGLYAIDSKSGKVYEINISSGQAALNHLVSTAQNSSGEVLYAEGKGFVAVGSYNNTAPGLYAFDPTKPSAGCTLVGDRISAQYLCVASPTKGYVTALDYMGTYANALYSFNPSNAGAGLTKIVDLAYPQEVVLGGDSRIYAAENGSGKVARLDVAGTAIDVEIATSTAGTTGLLAGTHKGKPGVFVANSGGYDASWNALPGSLDFIANSGNTASAVVSGISFARIAAFTPTLLVASGGFPSKTWLIDLSATTIAPQEVKYGTLSFGGSDIAVAGGKAYIPDGTNTVYVFGDDGIVTTIAVGTTGEMVTNVGAAQ